MRCIEHLAGTKTLQAGIFLPPVKRYNFQIASDFVKCLQLFSAFINSGVFLVSSMLSLSVLPYFVAIIHNADVNIYILQRVAVTRSAVVYAANAV